ncbi:hypothetical protein B0O99DRAFT_529653, partial [Bisporella sp. PMI_857]
WSVLFSTLRNRMQDTENRVIAAKSLQKLSKAQKEHLFNWVLTQEALGVPLTHGQIRQFATCNSQARLGTVTGCKQPIRVAQASRRLTATMEAYSPDYRGLRLIECFSGIPTSRARWLRKSRIQYG